METIKLDLIPGKKMPSLHASQFDDGRAYHIDLTENRVPYVLDGTETISVIIRKCDNTLVSMDIANTFANKSYLEFEVTEQMTACSGFNYGEIILEKNGDRLGSLNFYLVVETAPDENGITSQSEIKNLERQVHDIVVEELADNGAEETGYDNTESGLDATNVQDAIDELAQKPSVDAYTKQESDAFITDEYSATSTYAIGDMVIHENALYVCSTAITTAEAWNSAHWTLTDIATAIGTVKTAIPTKTSDLQNDSGFAQIDDSEESASKTYSSEKIEAVVGGVQSEVDDTNEGISDYLYDMFPYDRQLFNYATMTPDTPIKKAVNSSNKIVEINACRLYYIEVSGVADEVYSFNIINPTDFHISDLYCFATNSLETGTTVKKGSCNVSAKRGYVKLDGNYKYICVAMGSTLSGQDNITAECNEIVKKLVLRVGATASYDETYYPYAEYPVYKIDSPYFFYYVPKKTLLCGENLLTNDASTVGTGWSGSLANGYAHSSGTNNLVFTLPLTSGKKYILSFDATGVTDSLLWVKIDNNVEVDIYNNLTTFVVGFVSDGTGTLTFRPKNSYNGTITNITVREYEAGDNEITMPKYADINRGLENDLTGFWNTAISPNGLQSNVNGTRNVAIGHCALTKLETGTRNIGIGTFALDKITSGDHNVAIGSDALYMASSVNDAIAIGYASLINGANNSIAIGTMSANGSSGSAQGIVAIGHEAAWYANSYTVAIGHQAGYYLKGTGNVSIGKSAGNTLYVTGERNTCIGREASFDGTGSTSANPKTINNSIAIGNEAKITKSNQAVIGSTAITEVVFCGNKKINFNNDGTVTWETLT